MQQLTSQSKLFLSKTALSGRVQQLWAWHYYASIVHIITFLRQFGTSEVKWGIWNAVCSFAFSKTTMDPWTYAATGRKKECLVRKSSQQTAAEPKFPGDLWNQEEFKQRYSTLCNQWTGKDTAAPQKTHGYPHIKRIIKCFYTDLFHCQQTPTRIPQAAGTEGSSFWQCWHPPIVWQTWRPPHIQQSEYLQLFLLLVSMGKGEKEKQL